MIRPSRSSPQLQHRQQGFLLNPHRFGGGGSGNADAQAVLSAALHYWDLEESDTVGLITPRADSVGAWTLEEAGADRTSSDVGLRGGSSVALRTYPGSSNVRCLNRTPSISSGDSVTLAGWVNCDEGGLRTIFREAAQGTNASQIAHWLVIGNGGTPGSPYEIVIVVTGANSGDYSNGAVAETFTLNTWHFVQAKINRSTGILSIRKDLDAWVNSTPLTLPAAYVGTADVSLGSTLIGTDSALDTLNGRLNYFGYYHGILTDSQLAYLYNAGAGKTYAEIVADAA